MQFHPPGTLSTVSFMVIVAAVAGALPAGLRASERFGGNGNRFVARASIGLVAWLGLLAFVVASGVLERVPMPGLPLFFLAVNVAAVALAISPIGRALSTLPIAYLVLFQAFRFPLELVLHSWFLDGSIPETMTWTGKNIDVVTGILALVSSPFVGRNRAVAWLFDAIGLALLLNVMRVAVLSSPVAFGWRVEPPLLLVLHVPYFMIAPVCVAGALAGHVVLTRALLGPPASQPSVAGRIRD